MTPPCTRLSGSAADIRKIAVDCDSFITNCWTMSHEVKWKGTERRKKTTSLEELLNVPDIQLSWLFFKKKKQNTNFKQMHLSHSVLQLKKDILPSKWFVYWVSPFKLPSNAPPSFFIPQGNFLEVLKFQWCAVWPAHKTSKHSGVKPLFGGLVPEVGLHIFFQKASVKCWESLESHPLFCKDVSLKARRILILNVGANWTTEGRSHSKISQSTE